MVARGAFGAADSGPGCAHGSSGSTPASETRPSKCALAHKMYFPWLLESPSECDAPHIVMFLTWLLESPSECEIAHMVPRARTLVPISESETKLTYQVPGFSQHRRCVIARGRLRVDAEGRGCGVAPSGFEIAPLRASGALPVGLPRRGRLRRSEGPSRASEGRLRAWEGPRRSGGLRVSLRSLPGRLPGLRCSSRRALRRSRFRCPLGFPFSLSPCCTSILSTATPRVKPQRCVLRHISEHHTPR